MWNIVILLKFYYKMNIVYISFKKYWVKVYNTKSHYRNTKKNHFHTNATIAQKWFKFFFENAVTQKNFVTQNFIYFY